MAQARNGDAVLWYEAVGEGPAIVFAHGAGGNAASWWQQVPAFRNDHRVITFDHRGFGRSTCSEFGARHFDGDLVAILDAERIDKAAIVCQSMGGWTGVRTAALHPERVHCLVLANTPGAVFTEEAFGALRQVRPPGPGGGLAVRAISRAFAERDPAGAHLYAAISAFNPPRDDVGRGLLAGEAFVDDAVLANYRTPTLLITSDLDDLIPPAAVRATAPKLRGRIVEVSGAGHSVYFEMPERFNAIVREFLAEQRW